VKDLRAMPPEESAGGETTAGPEGFRVRATPLPTPTSVGDAVYDQILAALQHGRLRPGERLHDAELAAQLGVSRTPVREALLRLRQIGVVELAPARYTRVAVIDRTTTEHAVAAWVTVYSTIAAEAALVGLPETVLGRMREVHVRYGAARDPYDQSVIFSTNSDFYDEPTRFCSNPLLVRLADSVVHIVRLGLLQLPRQLDPDPLFLAQEDLLSALHARDHRAARRAVFRIAEIHF
jgi:DNA-binding GntR family transcriptional regulator